MGNYCINVTNVENENYTGSSAVASFEITKASSMVNIINVENGVFNTVRVIVDVDLINTTEVKFNITKEGKDVVYDDINNLNESLFLLSVGSYCITIINGESENYTASSANAEFVITQAASSVNIDEIKNVTYPDNVNITFSVENVTSVIWTVYNDDGKVIATGSEIEEINISLVAGNYSIVVINEENENYTASNSTKYFKVNKAASLVTIEEFDDVVYNTLVDIKFSVDNVTSVNWILVDGEGNVVRQGSGVDNITDLLLAAGNYSIEIINEDTDNITGYIASYIFEVYQAKSLITVNPFDNVTYGSDLIVNFTVDKYGNVTVDRYPS